MNWRKKKKKPVAKRRISAKPKPKVIAKPKLVQYANGLKTWLPDEPMESEAYLGALRKLGLTVASQRTAKALGVNNVRQCQRFATSDAVIPASVARLLSMYLKYGLPADVIDES